MLSKGLFVSARDYRS
uniref:Uncharacterized protein n=1 Tax=Arundo donax TaxID=35708 RepID=A0A0A9G7M9_ARUDO